MQYTSVLACTMAGKLTRPAAAAQEVPAWLWELLRVAGCWMAIVPALTSSSAAPHSTAPPVRQADRHLR